MLLQLLRVKIQQLIVSESSESYPGSISLPNDLIKASGLKMFELVHVNNLATGSRILTYVVIIAFGYYSDEEAENHRPVIVYADENNKLIESKTYSF